MTEALGQALATECLSVLGGFLPGPEEGLGQTLLMIGPGPAYWPHFTASAEYRDGQPDPMDRWSARVLDRIAAEHDARALYPFGGPPHHPFFTWATRTGRIWPSPVNFLVHAEQGLWVSFRGALVLDRVVPLPGPAARPCDTCAAPCVTACPVGALTPSGYDVAACKAHVRATADCTQGCRVRVACPVSQSFDRDPAQSAFHMEAFL